MYRFNGKLKNGINFLEFHAVEEYFLCEIAAEVFPNLMNGKLLLAFEYCIELLLNFQKLAKILV
jgi:hypothetical protein